MTADELLTAAIEDARTAYIHYEQMSTDELLHLHDAREYEQVHGTTPEDIAFAGGRRALIAAVLRKRGVGEERG